MVDMASDLEGKLCIFFRLSKREKLTLFFSTCEFTTEAQSFLNLFEHFLLFQFVLVYFVYYLLIYVCVSI